MESVSLTRELHNDWNNFCSQSNDAWFWHTAGWLEFMQNLNPKLESRSMSFLVKEKNETLAIVPLVLETKLFEDKEIKEFSFGRDPLPSPALQNGLDEKNRHKIHKFIFDYIDGLARDHGALRVTCRLSPLAPSFADSENPRSNYLTKYSFIDVSSGTRMIDLRKSDEVLWNELRRDHRRRISKVKEYLEISIYTQENITREIFDEYRLMHKKAAGRITRPLITFEKMYQWIRDGSAILVASKDKAKDKNVGFEYHSIYKNNVYSFSAANDPDYSTFPVRHLIEWKAMLWMKEAGCKYYEIGPEYYPSFYNFPSDKEMNISSFKRGFGGFTMPLFVGEKYYSKEYFEQTMKSRIEDYVHRYAWGLVK